MKVSLPDEPRATSTLVGLWIIRKHHQVLVSVAADECQGGIVHQVLHPIHLQRLVVPGDKGERPVLLLEAQQKDGLADVGTQDEALDAGQLVGVDLGVDESHAHQVCVLELPDVDFLANGGDKEAAAVGQGSDGALLLPLVQHLEPVLGERLARLRHHVYHVEDEDAAAAGDVLAKAAKDTGGGGEVISFLHFIYIYIYFFYQAYSTSNCLVGLVW